ncbi:MAG: amino acid-binding protein [Planctomycetota bacterium]
MSYVMKPIGVYAIDIMNRPGMLARILEALSNAGADLEFVIARRVTQNTTRVFVAPLKGAKVLRAAKDVGLQIAEGMHALRIEGPDRPGLGAMMTRGLASAGLSIRGLSAASIKKRSVCYIALATEAEMVTAQKVLKKVLKK